MIKTVLLIMLSLFLIFTGGSKDIPWLNTVENTPAENSEEISLTKDKDLYDPLFLRSRTDINFGDIEYGPYDDSEFTEKYSFILTNCGDKSKTDEVCSAYAFMYTELEKVSTYSSLSYIDYAKDVTVSETERIYTDTVDTYLNMSEKFHDAVTVMLGSANADIFTEFMGEDVAEAYEDEMDLNIELITELESKENKLETEYQAISAEKHSIIYNGRTWTFDDLYSAQDITTDEYYEIGDLLYKEYNSKAVPIYIELVNIRKQIAEAYGYPGFAEYCYENVYSRGYTPAQIERFHNSIKTHFTERFTDVYYGTFTEGYVNIPFDSEDIIPTLEKYMPEISREMDEALRNMTEKGMYYYADGEYCSNEAYTTMLDMYVQPFIYCAVSGDDYDLSCMIHEFGHYSNFYINEPASILFFGDDYDMCEVHSTGLEMLFSDYYDEIFGENASALRAELLTNALYTIITGCMYDEAQQRIYAYEGELTADAVNEIFRTTAEEYDNIYSFDEGYAWVAIPHTFLSPFYYISYAAAQTASLEIWLEQEIYGQEAAIEMYLDFMSYNPETYTLTEVTELCEMGGLYDDGLLCEIAEHATNKIYELYDEHLAYNENAA